MTPDEIKAVLEANPEAAKLLTAEYAGQAHSLTPEQIQARVAEEIKFRLAGPETAVDAMQAEAS